MNSASRPLRAAPPSPAWGPEPVTRMPTTTVTNVTTVVTWVVTAYQRGTASTRGPGVAYTRTTSDRRESDEGDRGEVVQADDIGIEVREHGDAADDRLQRHVEADRQREPEQVATLARASGPRRGT